MKEIEVSTSKSMCLQHNCLNIEKNLELPDIAGYTIKDAMSILNNSGWTVNNILIVKPPRDVIEQYDDSFRIIKVQKILDKSLNLLVCKPL